MRASNLLLVGLSTVSALPLLLPFTPSSKHTLTSRDNGNSNQNNNQVYIAGIVLGSIIGVVVFCLLVAYLLSHDNCFTRRRWFKRRIERRKYMKAAQQHLNPEEHEAVLKKRASLASERESIMFSKERPSSLNFAVVEDHDLQSQRRLSSQVYVLRDGNYVLLDKVEMTEQQRRIFSNGGRGGGGGERHGDNVSELETAVSDGIPRDRASLKSIPVIVSPPLENTHVGIDGMSRSRQSDLSSAYREILPDDPRTQE